MNTVRAKSFNRSIALPASERVTDAAAAQHQVPALCLWSSPAPLAIALHAGGAPHIRYASAALCI